MDDNYIPEGHTDFTEFFIGNIVFNPKSIGECKVEVYPNEGPIPHFHIFKPDHSFETCICIYSANYFAHGGKYRDTLNSKQCKQLNEWLELQNYNNFAFSITNWEAIVFAWGLGNPKCKSPNYQKVKMQPDYTRMLNFKDQ